MLIRPKRIYNFFLLHASFARYFYDIDELPYTFDHIWTNLLTQCTPVPVPIFCCFSISGFPHIKSAPKFRGNQIKNQREGTFRKHLGGARGPPPGAQAPWWRTLGAGRAKGPPGPLVAPLASPLRLYILRLGKPSRTEPFFAISPLFRRRRAFEIGSTRRPLPGTLPEGWPTSGSLLSTMDASRMSRE